MGDRASHRRRPPLAWDDRVAWFQDLDSEVLGAQQMINAIADACSVHAAVLDGNGDADAHRARLRGRADRLVLPVPAPQRQPDAHVRIHRRGGRDLPLSRAIVE